MGVVYNRGDGPHGGRMTMPLADHLRAHLAALSAAGVRFVPKAGPPPVLPVFEEPAAEVGPVDQGRVQLDALAAEVAKCERCPALFATRTRTVFGGGAVGAEVCFVGDVPRADDDLFPGEVDELLNRQLGAMGLTRDEVYFCAVLKCRTPRNRQPRPDECGNCREHLERQLTLVRPRAICCLGVAASQTLLNTTASIQELRGTVHDYRGVPVICTYHPAYVLEQPKVKRANWDDLQLVLKAIGRTPPGK